MMTTEEKIKMYAKKKQFVDSLSAVYSNRFSVENIKYEVYKNKFKDIIFFEEWIVVTFEGGAISTRRVTGNSDQTNGEEIARLIKGGYYDEVQEYRELSDLNYVLVDLEEV